MFFYYHGLKVVNNKTEKFETYVSGLEMRMAIRERLPRVGSLRPAVSAVLYEVNKGIKSYFSFIFVSYF
jgi:hypothetical protein